MADAILQLGQLLPALLPNEQMEVALTEAQVANVEKPGRQEVRARVTFLGVYVGDAVIFRGETNTIHLEVKL